MSASQRPVLAPFLAVSLVLSSLRFFLSGDSPSRAARWRAIPIENLLPALNLVFFIGGTNRPGQIREETGGKENRVANVCEDHTHKIFPICGKLCARLGKKDGGSWASLPCWLMQCFQKRTNWSVPSRLCVVLQSRSTSVVRSSRLSRRDSSRIRYKTAIFLSGRRLDWPPSSQ